MYRTSSEDTARRLFTAAVLALFFSAALILRTSFQLEKCFTPDSVNFQDTDPWYHVRAVEHLTANFPCRLSWDPYALQPDGHHVAVAPLFDLVLAAIALATGWEKPSPHQIHTICAWFPAVLGALVTLPAYFLGKRLHDRTCGFFAAAIVATIPGPFLQRSLLGYTDHHVAESLLSLLAALCLVQALPAAQAPCPPSGPRLTGKAVQPRHRRVAVPLAGLSLGAYLLTWVGGSLFVFILFLTLLIQLSFDHLKGKSGDRAAFRAAIVFVIALMMILPFLETPGFEHHRLALAAGAVALAGAALLSRWMRAGRFAPWQFPLVMAVLCGLAAGLFLLVLPSRAGAVLTTVRHFVLGDAGTQVIEAAPIAKGYDPISPMWEMFGFYGVLLFPGIFLVTWMAFRQRRFVHTLVLVWSVLMALLTLRQMRFGYYLAVNVALLNGLFWSCTLGYAARAAMHLGWRREGWIKVPGAILLIGMGWLLIVSRSVEQAREHTGPSPEWHEALRWLRDHSPEPFGAGDSYYADYRNMPRARPSDGVLCWWDHGYWVTAIARRVPTANPTQAGAGETARFFTAESEAEATAVINRLEASYVIIDSTLPIWETEVSTRLFGKFPSIARWAGRDPSEFFETFLLEKGDGEFDFVTLYYPAYYRSMLIRLYAYAGRAVTPETQTWAVRFDTVYDARGRGIKKIEEVRRFPDYAAAERFVSLVNGAAWRIACLGSLESCVPLTELRHFNPVFESPTPAASLTPGRATHIKIFQYTN